MKQITLKEVKEKLSSVADTIGRNESGNFVARRGYFYRHDQSSETFAFNVKAALGDGFEILDKWDKMAAFRGGASTAQSSHFGVEFRQKVGPQPEGAK